ncbi:MAG: ComF family protein [Wenzhouxiangellaceae bacterium]|nr:ComF family protein [Wenzhouxiangellaceae bacterium]
MWPRVCLVCGRASDADEDCCTGCRAALPVLAARCRQCAVALPAMVDACGLCLARAPAFDAAEAAFHYRPPIAGLIQRFKFNADLAAGRVLARLTAERLADCGAIRPQAMVPVPLNRRRRLRRGFNQAELLCRDLSRHFGGLPWVDAIRRDRATATQSELPAGKRGGNVRGAFSVLRLPPGLGHVAIVDDVMTTGATLGECARVLKRAGVGRVDVWVVARA